MSIMKNKTLKVVAISLISVLLLSTALSGCIDQPETSEEESILRAGFSWPTQTDPARGTDASSTTYFTNVYDPLFFPDPESDNGVEPWLAEDWTSSNNAQTWTIELKEDVTFHNGDEMTAEDVMFSMERIITMGEGYAYLFRPYVNLTESEVVDDYTVRFELDQSYGVFLSTLIRLYVVNEAEIMNNVDYEADLTYTINGEDVGDLGRNYLRTNDAGTGPYNVTEIVVQDHVYTEQFDDYWGPIKEDAADEFQMLSLGDPSTERSMFGEGNLEITSEWLPAETIESLKTAEGAKVGAYPSGGAFYGQIHNKKKPTDCKYVRKALSYMFDYESQIENIFPQAETMNAMVPTKLYGALDQDMPRQNMEKAQEALEKSKYYPEIVENSEDFEIEVSWTASVAATEQVALLLAENGEELGLNLNPVKYEWGSLIDAMSGQESSPHLAMVWVTAHYLEAGTLLESRYHSKTAESWEQNEWLLNDTIDSKINEALTEPNAQERKQLYEEIQEDLMNIYPSLFLHEQYSRHAYQPYVDFPQADNPGENAIPTMGYNINLREITVTPPSER